MRKIITIHMVCVFLIIILFKGYRSMVLAGLTPDIVLEIASRAIAFHSYQVSYELTFQEYKKQTAIQKLEEGYKVCFCEGRFDNIDIECIYSNIYIIPQSMTVELQTQLEKLKAQNQGDKTIWPIHKLRFWTPLICWLLFPPSVGVAYWKAQPRSAPFARAAQRAVAPGTISEILSCILKVY